MNGSSLALALTRARRALDIYIDAKDNTKPARIAEIFAPDAVLTFSLATPNIAFPEENVGVDAIAKTLVSDFGERYSRCRTYYVCDAPTLRDGVIDALPWLVVMRETAMRTLRIGHGTYRWTFDADASHVTRFHIHIARMDVIDDPDGALLVQLQDGLGYPWLTPGDLEARYLALADARPADLAFARDFARVGG